MLFLASTSPRRHAILSAAGIEFTLCRPGEEVAGTGAPIELARVRAASKASGAHVPEGALVLGVDTVVEVDGLEFGKPRDRADARRMFERLIGREHLVHTAHCLCRGSDSWEAVATASVRCDALSSEEIEAHLDRGEWSDKAGGYGVQGAAAEFMTVVEGDDDTVVGLSTRALEDLLRRADEGGACRSS